MPDASADRPAERVLAVDPGEVRVGLALSDPLGLTAQGLATFVRGRGDFLAHLAAIIEAEGVAELVVGHPRNLDGSEGEAARAARRLADRLRRRFGLPVTLWDERLSTVQARRAFPPGSRKDWDRVAATLILQSYLDARGAAGGVDP
jgi:putative Holliday junction resolvase